MNKYHYLNIDNKQIVMSRDGEAGVRLTPQETLLLALENSFEAARACINYIDKKRDEVRNEQTT
jgi:hypothetical protein